ncbi:Uncharacterised protein [Enterobacter cloacae]|nr:Uncharacterised protein [Enterobacter cloacae]
MRLFAELMPRLAQRQQCHRRIAPAAGFPVAAHSHQHKPALPPETPQLVGIAKADREIIFSAGTADQPLADAFPLAMGMNRNAADASAFQRRRERRAAVRCQRLRHQISTRPTKARPDCAAKFRG